MKIFVLHIFIALFVVKISANNSNSTYQAIEIEKSSGLLANESIPIFEPLGPFCAGSVIQSLPSISKNGIRGTWSPAIDNMKTATYTFTPDPGQSAISTKMDIVVVDEVIPLFAPFPYAYCKGVDIPALPTVSLNGISGSWSPDINNLQTTTYTFTPDAGQCALTVTLTLEIHGLITPTFNSPISICQGSNPPALPSISNNGIVGTWIPEVISTERIGSFVYTFRPDPGQCADNDILIVSINQIQDVHFEDIGPLCAYMVAELPLKSIEGITGTWHPSSTIDTHMAGTYSYRFIPDSFFCANEYSMEVVINPLITINLKYDPIKSLGETTEVTVTASGGSGNYISGVGTFSLNSGYHTFRVADDLGCYTETSVDIPEPQDLYVSISVIDRMKCAGGTDKIQVHVSGGTKPYSYSYKGGYPSYIKLNDSTFLLRAAIVPYEFKVFDSNGLYGSAEPLSINEIPALPAPNVIVTEIPVENIPFGVIKVDEPIPSQGITYVLSQVSSGAEQVTNTTGIFEGLIPGTIYNVGVVNISGCVSPQTQVSIPLVTSIDIDTRMSGLKIFPNPTSGMIKIEGLSVHKRNRISISTVDGKLIQKKTTDLTNEFLDISNQKAGTYLLNINDQTFKVVKK